jgi:phage terminase large subunit-like protein
VYKSSAALNGTDVSVFPVTAEHDDLVDACVYALVELKRRRGSPVLGLGGTLERPWA